MIENFRIVAVSACLPVHLLNEEVLLFDACLERIGLFLHCRSFLVFIPCNNTTASSHIKEVIACWQVRPGSKLANGGRACPTITRGIDLLLDLALLEIGEDLCALDVVYAVDDKKAD